MHAAFNKPVGVAVDGDGNAIVLASYKHRICKVTPEGWVSTLAGTGAKGYSDGDSRHATFNNPFGVVVDAVGNVIFADTHNHCIRSIAASLTRGPKFMHARGHAHGARNSARNSARNLVTQPRASNGPFGAGHAIVLPELLGHQSLHDVLEGV